MFLLSLFIKRDAGHLVTGVEKQGRVVPSLREERGSVIHGTVSQAQMGILQSRAQG